MNWKKIGRDFLNGYVWGLVYGFAGIGALWVILGFMRVFINQQ